MIHRPELLDALTESPVRAVDGTYWRHMFGERSPETENTRGARWNPPGLGAIYLSSTHQGAVEEGDHASAIQPFRPKIARYVYRVDLTLQRALDLSQPGGLRGAGLNADDLTDDDFAACQEVGAAAAWLEHDGLIVPSVRSTAINIVILPDLQGESSRFGYGDGEQLR